MAAYDTFRTLQLASKESAFGSKAAILETCRPAMADFLIMDANDWADCRNRQFPCSMHRPQR